MWLDRRVYARCRNCRRRIYIEGDDFWRHEYDDSVLCGLTADPANDSLAESCER